MHNKCVNWLKIFILSFKKQFGKTIYTIHYFFFIRKSEIIILVVAQKKITIILLTLLIFWAPIVDTFWNYNYRKKWKSTDVTKSNVFHVYIHFRDYVKRIKFVCNLPKIPKRKEEKLRRTLLLNEKLKTNREQIH